MFKDITKAINDSLNPDDYTYRAFYPGPPAATPDAWGRYPCVLTGAAKEAPLSGIGEPPVLPSTGRGATPDESLAALLDRLVRTGPERQRRQTARDRANANRRRNREGQDGLGEGRPEGDPGNGNIDWNKVMENVRAFISAGGKAEWKFLIFKHNEHQLKEAKSLSKELGFNQFVSEYSDRWKSSNWITGETLNVKEWNGIEKPESQKVDYGIKSVQVYEEEQFNLQKKLVCHMASNNNYEIYIRANGYVQPCCMLGDIDVHEPKRLIKDFDSVNLNKTPLEDILSGEFFKSLDNGINKGTDERLKNCFYSCGVK